jgi:hypothetical protein
MPVSPEGAKYLSLGQRPWKLAMQHTTSPEGAKYLREMP